MGAPLQLERLRFEINKKEDNDDPPRRKEISVFNADGTLYEGALISPSAHGSADTCMRMWVFDKIDKVPRVQKSYQIEGTRLHSELLEGWLLRREQPVSRSILDGGVMKLFPPPGGNLRAEECFVLRVYQEGEEPVVFWGFKDCEFEVNGKPRVNDLKTTSDMRWAKTRHELQRDIQCLIYAADRLAGFPNEDQIEMSWVYMTRNKPYKSKAVPVSISRALMLDRLEEFLPLARELQAFVLRADKLERVETKQGKYAALLFPPTTNACNMYGGCDYQKQKLCSDITGIKGLRSFYAQGKESKHKKKASKLLALAPEQNQEPEEKKMGFLSDLAKKKPELADKVEDALENAPRQEVIPGSETPEAAEEQQKAASPKPPKKSEEKESTSAAVRSAVSGKKSSTLQSLVLEARGAPPEPEEPAEPAEPVRARGVNPPDAKDPEEVQDLEENPPETEAARKKREKAAGVAARKLEREAAKEAAAAEKQRTKEEKEEAKKAGRPAGAKNKSPSLVKAFILLVDCVPLKGMDQTPVEELIAPSRTEVETEAEMDYRLIQYSEGPKMLGVQLLQDLPEKEVKGTFFVSSRTTEREVLDTLMRCADVVIKGGF